MYKYLKMLYIRASKTSLLGLKFYMVLCVVFLNLWTCYRKKRNVTKREENILAKSVHLDNFLVTFIIKVAANFLSERKKKTFEKPEYL